MEKYWFCLLLVGSLALAVKGQAEGLFPDYWQDDYGSWSSDESTQIETNGKNDQVINPDEAVDNNDQVFNEDALDGNNQKYNIEEVVNSEGLGDNDLEEIGEPDDLDDDSKRDEGINGANNDDVQLDETANSQEVKLREEIESFRKELAGENSDFEAVDIENEEDADGTLDDYQFEDNRSEVKEEAGNNLPAYSDGSFENINENIDQVERNEGFPIEENKEIFEETREILNDDSKENDFADADAKPSETGSVEEIVEETKQILQEDTNDFNENEENNEEIEAEELSENANVEETAAEANVEPEEISDKENIEQNHNNDQEQVEYDDTPDAEEPFVDFIDGIQQEQIEKFLVEKDDQDIEDDAETRVLLEGANNEEQAENQSDEDVKNYDEYEDTVEKVHADLNRDLEQLFDTWNKLSQDPVEKSDDGDDVAADNVEEYEQKYGKPFGEDTVLAQRGDYEDLDKDEVADDGSIAMQSNLGEILMGEGGNDAETELTESKIESNIPEVSVEDVDKLLKAGEIEPSDDETADYEDIIVGKQENEERQLNEESPVANEGNDLSSDEINVKRDSGTSDEDSFAANEDNNQRSAQLSEDTVDLEEAQGLVEEQPNAEDKVEIVQTTAKAIYASDLTSSQYDDLMRQFAIVHSSDIDPQSEDFAKHVAPVHIALSLDETTTVTSPNYPEAYPTNNIVDWIFDGEGVGIEFNVTDLDLNGAMGDYLLVKPGNLDESGTEGLIFSYHLTEPRQYRFLDVDRMFVRFQANPALGAFKGFSFSVKMVAPIPEEVAPPLPTPEPLLPPPANLTVYLGGLTLSDFLNVREEFRQLVADMATLYINTHGLQHEANTTLEVTQITSAAICNINWPNYERCVRVSFGVPLAQKDADDDQDQPLTAQQLGDMWGTYFYLDPFAFRLRRMGIVEFSSPDEGAVLAAWLVIGAGVLISAALLAFALWRFSCFEGYTRMSPYSDTDSIRDEKRNLDLYPTPHQTLPPLYSEEYKWADDNTTRVDMGGFANKSYARDELFDIESDEDVVSVSRDRYTSDV